MLTIEDSEKYFQYLNDSFHKDFFRGHIVEKNGGKDFLMLRENSYEMKLYFEGQAFLVKLDVHKKKNDSRLFPFLDGNNKPWAKKCDFVVFNRISDEINVHLIEFKSKTFEHKHAEAQLDASVNWLKSLKRIVEYYSGLNYPLTTKQFLFVSDKNKDFDKKNKYLRKKSAIRVYHYYEVRDQSLNILENSKSELLWDEA